MPTYTLRIRQRFEAAHHLRSYRGTPEQVHGHSWMVEAVLRSDELDKEGMAFDFVAVRDALRILVSRFDHGDINAVPPFDQRSPTTENIASWFFEALETRLLGVPLLEVTVWEGPDCAATYRP